MKITLHYAKEAVCFMAVTFFLTLSFSILIASEAIPHDSEPEVEDVGVEDAFERRVEKFWTKGLRLSLGEKISTRPAICALGDEIYVVWSDNRVGQRELFMRKSKDGGLTWGAEERLTESKADSVRPVVVGDGKQVHLVWEERSLTDSAIFYKRWDGTSWSEEQVLSLGLPNSRHPDIAVTTSFSGSIVYVVWESKERGKRAMGQEGKASEKTRMVAYLSRSEDGGSTWLKPRPIASPMADAIPAADGLRPAWNTSEPKVAGGVKTAYVVWRDERAANLQTSSIGQIFIKQWGPKDFVGNDIRLSAEGDYGHPDVSVSAQSVYVAWEGSADGTMPFLRFTQGQAVSDIFVAQSFDGGQTFSPPLQVTQSVAESTMPRIIALADDVWLFWQDGRMGNWSIYLAKKSSLSKNWGQIQQFTATDIDSIMPAVTSSPGVPFNQIHLLWVERESEKRSHLMYSRRDTIPPLPPDKPAHLDLNAKEGYDNDDTLTFYWSHPSGIRNEKREEGQEGKGARGKRSFIERPAKYNVYFTGKRARGQLELAGTTEKSSYSFKAESGKTYRITVEAVDEVGNLSELSEFSEPIFVDSHAPEVFIHNPSPNTSLLGLTPVIVTCQDDNLVEWRLFYKFTTRTALSWGEAESAPFEWKLLASSNKSIEHQRVAFWDVSRLKGVYTLELIAVDEAGNQSKVDIPVVVDNTPPIPITKGGLGTELMISDLDADYHSPAWSPDGSMIAYASNEGGAYDIWILDLKTRAKNRLTRNPAFDINPVWSPDSRWLSFQSFENGNWDIWLISVDGSERLPLVRDVASDRIDFTMDTTPAWSPNGYQLAFSSDADGDGEIWLVTNVGEVLLGGKPSLTQLTRNEWEDLNPTWSPDGTKIAFQSNRNGNWDIFCINIDGYFEKQLTNSVANEIKPKWSPDGKRILFISDRKAEAGGEILALEIHNDTIISLSPIDVDAKNADWSPDLKSMVYQAGNTIYLTDFNFPPPQIEAIITRPYQGEYILSGQPQDASEFFGRDGGMEGLPSNEVKEWKDGRMGGVDIIGIARGTEFQEYRLEYALVDSASNQLNWMPIGGVSTSPVPQVGFLGRLDTRRLQGEYILKLSVLGKNGDITIDDVSVFVEHELPRLVVTEPPNGLITDKPLIEVLGETEANVQVTINGERVKLKTESTSQTARFDTSLLLEEGENIITVVARRPTQAGMLAPLGGLETVVQRRVFLAKEKMTINVEAPKDFEVVNVPHVTVKGSVDKTAKIVKIQKTIVMGSEIQPYIAADYQTSPMKTFQRTILLHEGVNLISIEAIDQLNRLTRIQRRVIYEKPTVIIRDINPPAITNILPPDGVVIADARPEISAILADDVKIDPETIAFTFDGKEIDKKKFEFNEKDGKFSYIPEEVSLDDGEHNFTINVQDTSDNSAQKSVKFFIDTEPLEIAISAKADDAEDNSRLKIILASNKPLQSIPLATVIPVRSSAIYCALTNGDESPYYKRNACLGYSINLNRVVPQLKQGVPELKQGVPELKQGVPELKQGVPELKQGVPELKQGVPALRLDGKAPPFSFEGFFDATPLQKSFIFDAAVIDKFGKTYTVHGYYVRGSLSEGIAPFLWGQMKLGTHPIPSESTRLKSEMSLSEVNRLGISGIVEAIFPTTILEPVHNIVLRSQDGLDLGRLAAQRQNAEDRSLELIDIVHVVEADQRGEKMTFSLRLPIPKERAADYQTAPIYGMQNHQRGLENISVVWKSAAEKFAFFHWDARLQRWEAMDAIRNFSEGWIQAKADEFGAYALLADETPPTITNLRPRDNQEVPLDRFLVEAEVYDNGSGIDKDRIELLIDDNPAEFTFEPAYNRITYLPSNLKPGLHTLKLSVQDRASNVQTISSTFFTRDIFDFAEEVIAYPNPVRNADVVTVRFKLTKTADVTLKIYSVAGETIATLQKNNAIGRRNEWFTWDCKNQAKLPVASGVYLYIIEAESSEGQKVRRSGKIAVVK